MSSPLPPDHGEYYSGGGATATNSKSFVMGHNQVWTPTMVSSIRAGWNDLAWTNYFPNQSLTSVGIPGVSTVNPGFSDIVITGYPSLGVTNVPNADASQDRQLSGDVTWSKGQHNLKFGVQAVLAANEFPELSATRAAYLTSMASTPRIHWRIFCSVRLTPKASRIIRTSPCALPGRTSLCRTTGESRPKLTLNIGLRYELDPPSVQKNNTISNFDRGHQSGTSGAGAGRLARQRHCRPRAAGHQLQPMGAALWDSLTAWITRR